MLANLLMGNRAQAGSSGTATSSSGAASERTIPLEKVDLKTGKEVLELVSQVNNMVADTLHELQGQSGSTASARDRSNARAVT